MIQGALAPNMHLHDTYWIPGHFHYIIFGGMGFGLFAAFHYWFPKMFGPMYNRRMAKWSWLVMLIGFNIFYFSMLLLGWEGMPRRYYDHLPQFRPLQFTATFGSWILIAGLILMFGNLFRGLFKGEKVGNNPWGGARSNGGFLRHRLPRILKTSRSSNRVLTILRGYEENG